MRFISAAEIQDALSWEDVLSVVSSAMMEVSEGNITAPPRSIMSLEGTNGMGMMWGAMRNPAVHGMKLVSLYPDNPRKGLASHLGVMVLFNSETGLPIAALDAGALTALRTPAATALATNTLAQPDAHIFTILGAGEQAHRHAEAFLATTGAKEVRIWARREEAAVRLSEKFQGTRVRAEPTLEAAVTGANVITCVTAATNPVLRGSLLEPGQHVNLVGSSVRTCREIDREGTIRLRLYVDSRASAILQAGEYLDALDAEVISPDFIIAEIGEVLSGRAMGRTNSDQITGYKSLGVSAQDLSVSWAIAKKYV